MKKLFIMLLTLFGAYFAVQILFVFFGRGHNTEYVVGDFKVSEVFESNSKVDADSYFISIKNDKSAYSFQVFDDFFKASGIVKEVKYYSDDEYNCVLPVFMGKKILTDVMCQKNGITIFYNNMNTKSDGIKQFYADLQNEKYDLINGTDNLTLKEIYDEITLYKGNMIDKHYIGMSNQVGYYQVNSAVKVVKKVMFGKVLAGIKLNAFVGPNYIVADYTKIDIFNRFFVSNIVDGKSYSFSVDSLPLNSYVLGTYGDSMYIYISESKKEFEVDAVGKNIVEVGNESTNINFYNGNEWERKPTSLFSTNEVKFTETNLNDYTNLEYYKILKKGNETGYYYLFKKIDNIYEVYRAPIADKENLTYIFSTTDSNKLKFVDGYIYYLFNDQLKYYNDKTGNRTVLINPDFINFDNTIYTVYREK